MFEYYVMNESRNSKQIEPFNIFSNWVLDEAVQKEIKQYLRSPKKYKHIKQYKSEYSGKEEICLYGFDALCEEIRKLIMWQEWSRCEYEIVVKSLFDKNGETEQKIDCYEQCKNNIPMIARECIWQYKNNNKENKK